MKKVLFYISFFLVYSIISVNYLYSICNANFIYLVQENNKVRLISTSQYQDTDFVKFYWDMGDGNVIEGNQTEYTYEYKGSYNVTLFILTDKDCFDRRTKKLNVGIDANSSACILNIYFETINASPPAFNNGSAIVSGTGDYPGYYYSNWSNGEWGAVINNLEPGVYCVTLTRDFCYGSDCVVITNSNDCSTSFTYENIPVPGEYGYYRFLNNSSGEFQYFHWQFGDDNESVEPNPVHYYEEPGDYNVCVTIMTYSGCTDTYCQTIQVIDTSIYYADFSGMVYAGNVKLPIGIAVLYKYEELNYTAIDIAEIYNGIYSFQNLFVEDFYLTHIIPFFNTEEIYFPKYFPVYSFSEPFWQNNSIFSLSEISDTLVTNLISYNTAYFGYSSISGYVYYSDEAAFEEDIFAQNWLSGQQKDEALNPAPNMVVFLLNVDREIISYTKTGNTGFFMFSDLPAGNYFVMVEKAGYQCEEKEIVLHDLIDFNEVSFIIHENSIVSNSINNFINELNLVLFPNPFYDFVVVQNNSEQELAIEIFTISGICIFDSILKKGNNNINLGILPSGVYFVNIQGEGKDVNKKLIKF